MSTSRAGCHALPPKSPATRPAAARRQFDRYVSLLAQIGPDTLYQRIASLRLNPNSD